MIAQYNAESCLISVSTYIVSKNLLSNAISELDGQIIYKQEKIYIVDTYIDYWNLTYS